jgi:hypothetical protein
MLENSNKKNFLIKKQLFKESTGHRHRHRRVSKENSKEGSSKTQEKFCAEIIPSKQQKILREIISQCSQGRIAQNGPVKNKSDLDGHLIVKMDD